MDTERTKNRDRNTCGMVTECVLSSVRFLLIGYVNFVWLVFLSSYLVANIFSPDMEQHVQYKSIFFKFTFEEASGEANYMELLCVTSIIWVRDSPFFAQ